MVGEASSAQSRRFGSFEVVDTIAKPRSTDGSTVFIAIARPPKAERDTSGKLALSFSPAKPNEPTKTLQRPVVIKQLAPNLTADKAKLDAFLEAARAATTLRHANVAEIDSVGTEGNDVYLVLDYRLGETAASLLRRLQAEGERLRTPLAAYIASQVCAALDAGHSAGLLHTRLTPHDIFIGYDGSVSVLDIGVAPARAILADGRVSGVELEYASPEVCRKETLDPRTDVFTLGVILWELLSGLSPFERAADADVVRAICDDSVVPPRNIVPGIPRELSAITLQALLRDRGERFQTAKALGSALEQIVKTHIVGKPNEHLAKLMKKVFASRETDKREMLKRVLAGTSIAGLDIQASDRSNAPARNPPAAPAPPVHRAPPAPPPDEDAPTNILSLQAAMTPAKSHPPSDAHSDQPSVIIKPPMPPPPPVGTLISTLPSGELHLETEPEAPPPLPAVAISHKPDMDEPVALPVKRVGNAQLVAIIGGILGIVIVLAVVFSHKSSEPKVIAPQPSATIAARESPPPAPAPPPAPEPTSSVTTTSTPAPDVETTLHVETVPAQASIFVGGTKKGTSPLDLRVAKSDDPIIVEIRHPGYATLKERVVPDVNQRLKLTLLANAGGAKAPAPTPSPYKKFE